jgi:hypothetical protein
MFTTEGTGTMVVPADKSSADKDREVAAR